MKRFIFITLLILFLTLLSCTKNEEPTAPEIKGSRVYIVNNLSETVSIYDEVKDTLFEDVIITGVTPNDIYQVRGLAYIVNSGFGGVPSIQVIDLSTNEIIKEIQLPPGSNPWAITKSANRFFVTLSARNMVYIYDSNLNLIDSIKIGKWPEGIIYYKNSIFIASSGLKPDYTYDLGYVYVLKNPDSIPIIDSIPVKTNPQDFAVSPEGEVFVLCTGDYNIQDGWILEIDPESLLIVDSLHIGGYPGDITYAQQRIFASDWFNGLLIYDLATGKDTIIPTGYGSSRLFAKDEKVYLTIFSGSEMNYLLILDALDYTIEKKVELGVGKGAQAVLVYKEEL